MAGPSDPHLIPSVHAGPAHGGNRISISVYAGPREGCDARGGDGCEGRWGEGKGKGACVRGEQVSLGLGPLAKKRRKLVITPVFRQLTQQSLANAEVGQQSANLSQGQRSLKTDFRNSLTDVLTA